AVVFPSVYQESSGFLVEEQVVIMQGIAEVAHEEQEGRRGHNQIRVNRLMPLDNAPEVLARQIGIVIPTGADESLLFKTKEILKRNPGKLPVTLIFDEHGHDTWRVPCGDIRVSASDNMITEIRELLGDDAIKMDIETKTELA
ncbi:MAG: hypothetical protein HRU16_06580, partial [Planctomycetes bacterium]|nr:hypothetical protein [Planctomycetota bacterium]